ncbi:MAG TPA: hypothetical protein DCG49_01090 [Ruminococcus sp.]|nr:hypothetical protein [Ruminococcus sp.]
MNGNALHEGQKLSIGAAGYLIAKQILNGIISGFGGTDLLLLLFAAAAGFCFWKGVKKSNLIAAIIIMAVACAYMPGNLKHFRLLYIIEGVLDMLCAVLLAFHPAIRTHCKMSN